MSLTGAPLMVLLIVLAIAAMAFVVWVSPMLSGGKVANTLTRVAFLVGCQVMALLVVLDLINAQYEFYQSWGDLFGTSTAVPAAAPQLSGESRSAIPDEHTRGWVRADLRHATTPLVSDVKSAFIAGFNFPPAMGQLQSVVIRGQYSGITAAGYVYLPPQYFLPQNRTRRFPVMVSLTGYPGNAISTITKLKLPQLVADEIVHGRVQPLIILMLRPTVAPPRDTECTNVPGGPQAETFLAGDVPTAIKTAYRVPRQAAGWAIFGDSTGGYCAMKLAMMHSERYSAAVSLAGYFHALKDITTGDLYGGSTAFRNENDLFWRLAHLPAPPVNMLLTSSRVGERDYPQTLQFLAQAPPPMHVSSIILPSGGHHFDVWQREVPPAMYWLTTRLNAGT